MAASVFISYSTADLVKANELKQTLENETSTPFRVFLADSSVRPGENLPNKISEAIRSCDFFVLLWSGDADSSKWVPQEIGLALAAGKPIFPIVLSEGLQLPAFLSNLKYLAAFKGEEEVLRWITEELDQKARTLQIRNYVAFGIIAVIILYLLLKK
jgi:hypothetical protein